MIVSDMNRRTQNANGNMQIIQYTTHQGGNNFANILASSIVTIIMLRWSIPPMSDPSVGLGTMECIRMVVVVLQLAVCSNKCLCAFSSP